MPAAFRPGPGGGRSAACWLHDGTHEVPAELAAPEPGFRSPGAVNGARTWAEAGTGKEAGTGTEARAGVKPAAPPEPAAAAAAARELAAAAQPGEAAAAPDATGTRP
jgi:hypothetical protein